MALNQQLDKEDSKDFYKKITDVLNGWLPYVTNYCELKEKGWHKEYDAKNEYVSEKIKNDERPFLKQYHHAWSSCPKKEELVEMVKSCSYFNTDEALKTLKEITGIDVDQNTVELSMDEVAKKFGVDVNNLKIKK